jgi:ethanolamine utilization protein EutN
MFLGKVVGSVWSTVKWPGLAGLKLLNVQPYHVSDLTTPDAPKPRCHDLVVCADVIDAGVGDDVVVAFGHAARCALEGKMAAGQLTRFPIDAAIVAIVDLHAYDVAPEADPPKQA